MVIFVGLTVKLKILKLEIPLVIDEVFNSFRVYFMQFAYQACCYKSMLESKSWFFGARKDEMIEVVEDELERLRVGLVDLN